MSKKIIRMTPDQLGYKDRGKMKWQGLMLSDHSEALRRIKNDQNSYEPKPKKLMSEVDIAQILQLAYISKVPVKIQANIVRNNNFFPDLHCLVLGYEEDKIYLKLSDGRLINCKLSQIRNITFSNPLEWNGKT